MNGITENKLVGAKYDTGVVKGNIVGILCYLGGILSALLLLMLEKDNKFVKFHAMQSIVTFVIVFVFSCFLYQQFP